MITSGNAAVCTPEDEAVVEWLGKLRKVGYTLLSVMYLITIHAPALFTVPTILDYTYRQDEGRTV
jgi:hypothetical protein